jgi:hypothetical protein
VQTTLLGLAIAFIIALIAALGRTRRRSCREYREKFGEVTAAY